MNRHLASAQSVLKVAQLYDGVVDGKEGPKTRAAIRAVFGVNDDVRSLPASRAAVMAAQTVLNKAGFEAGAVDGYWGHNTENAAEAYKYHAVNGRKEVLEREPVRGTARVAPVTGAIEAPHQRDCKAFYGSPGKGGPVERQLVRVPTYTMRIDWNLSQTTSAISLHRKCADSAQLAFAAILRAYGQDRLTALGLDRFAGSYNPRKMRGGNAWSMHAYGCAIDFYAAPNGLRMRCPEALFCKPEYAAFFDIWEAYGWTSLGRAIGRDWMHVQAAHL